MFTLFRKIDIMIRKIIKRKTNWLDKELANSQLHENYTSKNTNLKF